jgi:hypothetical protein
MCELTQLRKRQDLLAVVTDMVSPSRDMLVGGVGTVGLFPRREACSPSWLPAAFSFAFWQTIEIPVTDMEPFVFAVVRKKDKKALLKVAKDLVRAGCLSVSTLQSIHPSTAGCP